MSEKKNRVKSALAGETCDRLPVTLWRHNFLREWSASDLADETISLYRRFDWDLIKLNPRWSYLPEAWGNRYAPPTEQRFQREIHRIINEPSDLDRVEAADPTHPSLVEQLDAIERVVAEIGDEVDILHTVFSPLSVLGLLAGGIGEPLLTLAEANPKGLDRALEAVRETVLAHIRDAVDRGAAGVFFAPTQWTSLDVCGAEAYARFGRPHDLWVLERIQEARFSALHICGNNISAARFADYPVDIFSWDDRGKGNPTISGFRKLTDKTLMAGLPHRRIHKLASDALVESVFESVGEQRAGLILGGGCAVGALVEEGAMRAARDLAETFVG